MIYTFFIDSRQAFGNSRSNVLLMFITLINSERFLKRNTLTYILLVKKPNFTRIQGQINPKPVHKSVNAIASTTYKSKNYVSEHPYFLEIFNEFMN